MSKALIILTCPECGSENVTFDGNCTCYCNSCKCKYDVSMNTNVNYIDSLYDVELDDNIRLVKEFRRNGCQSKLLSMRCDNGKTYVNAILQNDGYDFYTRPVMRDDKEKYKRLAFQSFMDEEFERYKNSNNIILKFLFWVQKKVELNSSTIFTNGAIVVDIYNFFSITRINI